MIEDQTEELLGTKSKMGIPRRKLTKLIKIGVTICVITALGILVTTFATGKKFSTFIVQVSQGSSSLASGRVSYNKASKTLTFTDTDLSQDYLNINVNYDLKNSESKVSDCNSAPQNDHVEVELSSNCAQLNLEFENDLHGVVQEVDLDGMQCHSVQWQSYNQSSEITNCFIMEDNWYGGGGLSIQKWPLNRVNVPLQAHITQFTPGKLEISEEASFESFIEPYFVSAKGAAILFKHYLPLFISMNHHNDKKVCFTSSFKKPYATVNKSLLLKYLVCKDRTAKSMHRHLLKTTKVPFFKGSPEMRILRKPIWSTRGLDRADINEVKVLAFINEIKSRKLPYGHLFIDGNYSKYPGIFYFNELKFPRSHQLIMELNSPEEEKFPVGTEVYPYIPSQESKLYAVKYNNNTGTTLNQDKLHFLDVTNEAAVTWYKSKLSELNEQISLSGFRFSGGYAQDMLNGVDQSFLITNKTLNNPNFFTMKYAEVASEFKATYLLGSGYNSQSYTFVADAGPMMSSWEHNKGLKSIIPTMLTYGIMGYPFGLAGPVGGLDLSPGALSGLQKPPDKELYIRWLQLVTYLPVMELSVGPWVYGEEVVNYAQTLLTFRHKELWPKTLSTLVEEAVKLGTPIARPLWWIAPEDKIAQFIDCEFFLGNSLLVAPVLYDNARQRNVYLPEGSWWRDQLRGELYKGGKWLRNFKVGLYEIATFKRDTDPQS